MTVINGIDMPNFTHKEIPKSIEKAVDKRILMNIQEYRNILGCPFFISLDTRAIVRFDGRITSCHKVIVSPFDGTITKISTAIDGFPDCDSFKSWSKALSSNLFGGVGVYFDTNGNDGKPCPMFHLDLRPISLIWYRDDGKYFYPHKNKTFFKDLQNLFMIHGIK